MNETFEVRGDLDLLLEFGKELKSKGISADIWTAAMQCADGGGYSYLHIVGDLTAIALVAQAYWKNRRAHLSLESDGKKIVAEGKTTEETKELFRYGVLSMKKLENKKDDA